MGAPLTRRKGVGDPGLAPGTAAPSHVSLRVTLCLRRGGRRLGVWGRGRGTRYLSTRSEAWLDLDASQLWCFSWAFASFSAAAIGHPDRLQRETT